MIDFFVRLVSFCARAKQRLKSGAKMADATRRDLHWDIFIDQSDWRTLSILPNFFSEDKHLGTRLVFLFTAFVSSTFS